MCCWLANQPAAFGPSGHHCFNQLTWPNTQLPFEQLEIVGPVPLGRYIKGRCYDWHCWHKNPVWRFRSNIGFAFLSLGRCQELWLTKVHLRYIYKSGSEGSSQQVDSHQIGRIQPKRVVLEAERKTRIYSYFKRKSVSLGKKLDIRNEQEQVWETK